MNLEVVFTVKFKTAFLENAVAYNKRLYQKTCEDGRVAIVKVVVRSTYCSYTLLLCDVCVQAGITKMASFDTLVFYTK